MRKKINLKIAIPILVLIGIVLIYGYGKIIKIHFINREFLNTSLKIAEKNENTIFSIKKIVLCSSANAIDKSEDEKLKILSVYQYTDIAVYIENKNSITELTDENTVKELYIDNISMQMGSDLGNQAVGYKNILEIGSKENSYIENNSERIDFNIIYTNEQNSAADYSTPQFYTDCSNPITIGYCNKDLASYKMPEGTSVSFDGKILEKAGVSTESIKCKIKFKVNIKNNKNENFSCWVRFDIPLQDIYRGTTMKSKETSGTRYNFWKL